MNCRLRAPAQTQKSEHEGGCRIRGAAQRPLEVTEPGHRPSERRLHCVEGCLGVGKHRCGRVLSAAEPICGFGRVDSDRLELWWGEAQNLRTPKHPSIRASESQIASVCPLPSEAA